MDTKNAEKLLLENFHWGILGVSIVLVIATFFLAQDTKAIKSQNDLNKLLKELKNSSQSSVTKETIPDYLSKVRENWGAVKQSWKIENAPQDMSQGYLLYERAKIKYIPAVPPSYQWINKPDDISMDVDREKLKVTWIAPKDLVEKDGKKKDMTSIDGYILEKKWDYKGEKKEKLIEFAGDTFEYEDSEVETNIDYFYKVRAFTNNVEAKGGETIKFKDKDIVVSKYTKDVQGKILPSYKMRLLGVAGDIAIIEIYKWVKGDWRSTICHIKKGNKIEASVFVKDMGKIDFTPGWTLKYIKPDHPVIKEVPIKTTIIDPETRQPKRGEDGKILYQIVMQPMKHYVPMIGYLDEKGDKHTLIRDEQTPPSEPKKPKKPKGKDEKES